MLQKNWLSTIAGRCFQSQSKGRSRRWMQRRHRRSAFRQRDVAVQSIEVLEVRTLLAAALVADNHYVTFGATQLTAGVVNGDFETGDLSGWTTFTTAGGTLGGAGFPDVVEFDADGNSVATESFQVLVGDGGGGLFHTINMNAGSVTVTSVIAANSSEADSEGGLFQILFDGEIIASHDFEDIAGSQTERAVLSGTVQNVTSGDHEVRFLITRDAGSAFGSSPLGFIDDIKVFGNSGGVLANDGDPDGDVLNALLVSHPEHGTVQFQSDGSFDYVADPGFEGEDSFVYKAVDQGQGLTLYAVDAVNDKLIKIDTRTGGLTVVGSIGHDMFAPDLAYLDGLLYATTDTDGSTFNGSGHILITIDPATGAKTAEVPITREMGGFSWAESLAAKDGKLYIGHNNASIGEIDPLTGVITNVLTFQGRDFDGLGTDNQGDLASLDGVLFSGSTVQMAFHRIMLDPPSVEFTGDYLLVNGKGNDLEFTPSFSWTHSQQILYRNLVDRPSHRIESIDLGSISTGFGGLAYAAGFETETATVTISQSGPVSVTLPDGGGSYEVLNDGSDLVLRVLGGAELVRRPAAFVTELTVTGSAGADLVTVLNTGTAVSRPISFNAGDGNDVFNGSLATGPLTLDGEGGNDVLRGGKGDDSIDGGSGDDLATGKEGNDVVSGGAGNDRVFGSAGADSVSGGEGNDTVNGQGGIDQLVELVSGQFLFTSPTTATGLGTDVVLNFESAVLTGNDEDNVIDVRLFNNRATLIGGAGNDILRGTAFGDKLFGGDGNDKLFGAKSRDTLDGGNGDNTLNGQGGIDRVIASGDIDFTLSDRHLIGFGTDKIVDVEKINLTGGDSANLFNLTGYSGKATVLGGGGDDTMLGGSGNELMRGGDGDDQLRGRGGADRLFGDSGADRLLGGGGNDQLAGGLGDDTINGGGDIDRLNDEADVDFTIADLQITGNGTDQIANIEKLNIKGGPSDNVLDASGYSGFAILQGRDGNDTLIGGSGNNILNGNSGDDSLVGNDGNDRLNGGGGNDNLTGGNGDDTFIGKSGTDRIVESADVNFTLTQSNLTGRGADQVSDVEEAQLTGGPNNNTLDASAFLGDVTLTGDAGNDSLVGGFGDDMLIGGDGDDTLRGGQGTDTASAGDGADTIDDDIESILSAFRRSSVLLTELVNV